MCGRMVKILEINNYSFRKRYIEQVKIDELGDSNYKFDHSLTNPDSVEDSEHQINTSNFTSNDYPGR